MKYRKSQIYRAELWISLILGIWLWFLPVHAQDLSLIKDQKPVQLHGGLELRNILYKANGIENRRQPFSYLLSGSPTLSIYGIHIPFQFILSKEERSFQQPFNQFGLSPQYKWVTVHGGYRNVNFSPYTLAGHTLLGGGIELNPGKIRAGFMYGRLNRASIIDTLTHALVPYSFDRRGMAAKIGYGTDRNHFDLHFLKAQDDSTSMPNLPMNEYHSVSAAANSVLAYGTKFTFLNHFTFKSDGAISLYTNDVNSPLVLEDLEDARLNRWKNILRINGSSEWFLAFQAGLAYNRQNYGLQIKYRRIEPEFKSMGAYFFSNDVENITFEPRFSLPNGRLRFQGSLGIEQDNVNLQKQSTSKRVIGSALMSTEITNRLGIDLNYSNYSNNQQPKTLVLADSLKIVQTTQNWNITPRYYILGQDMSHMFIASVNFNGMKDYNNYFGTEADSRDISTQQYMINYNISFPKKSMSLFTSLTYTDMEAMGSHTVYQGISVGGNYALLNNKIRTGLHGSLTQGKQSSGNSWIFNGSANINYQVFRSHGLRFAFFFTKNNPGSVITGVNPSFSETRGELAYQINLGL